VYVVDRVFETVLGAMDRNGEISPLSVIIHPSSAIDETAVAQAQATLCRRILSAFVGRGLLDCFEAKDMLG
jgi:hypothetical protein